MALLYRVRAAKQYRRSLKRLTRSGCFDIAEVEFVIRILSSGLSLDRRYRNHPLQGEYAGCFECHIESDLLLIYEPDTVGKVLTLTDIGSHSDLFG